jgi:hypothetical protein
MLLDISHRLVEPIEACRSPEIPQRDEVTLTRLTSVTQIPQGLLISLEVIVDLELLVIRLQGPQLPKER